MLHLFCALNMKFICGSRPQQWEKKDHNHTKHSVEVILKTRSNAFRSKVSDPRSSTRKVDQSARARAAFYGEDSPTYPSHPTFFFFFCLQHRFAVVTRGSGQEAERRAGAKRQEGVGRETSTPPPFSFLAAARFPFATGRPIPVDPFVESSGQ